MQNFLLIIVILVMTVTPAVFAATGEPISRKEPPAATTQDRQTTEEKAIRATAEAFTAAFNKGDAKAIAALWTKDCEYVDENGRIYRGRDTIEKEYAAFFAAHAGAQIETSISSVNSLGGNAAVEDGTATIKKADGALVSKASYTAVHLKENDKWLMASVREYAAAPLSVRPDFGSLEWLIGDWTASKDSRTVDFAFKWVAEKKFIELSYTVRDKGAVARSGIQVIGHDPVSGAVASWSFDSTGGFGQGQWTILKKGLVIESRGVLPDGAPAASTNIVSKIDGDSFTWQSVNRRVAGQSLNDAEPVVLKRKSR